MFAGATQAFEEDREVLVHVHQGMARSRTRSVNLKLDVGAVRFRRMVEAKAAAET